MRKEMRSRQVKGNTVCPIFDSGKMPGKLDRIGACGSWVTGPVRHGGCGTRPGDRETGTSALRRTQALIGARYPPGLPPSPGALAANFAAVATP